MGSCPNFVKTCSPFQPLGDGGCWPEDSERGRGLTHSSVLATADEGESWRHHLSTSIGFHSALPSPIMPIKRDVPAGRSHRSPDISRSCRNANPESVRD